MINLTIGGSRIGFWRLKNSSWRYQNGSLKPPKWGPETSSRCKELPSSLHLRSEVQFGDLLEAKIGLLAAPGWPRASQEAQQVAKHLPKRSLESPKRSPRGQNITSKAHLILIILFYDFSQYFLVIFLIEFWYKKHCEIESTKFRIVCLQSDPNLKIRDPLQARTQFFKKHVFDRRQNFRKTR